jgi:hypothetical protein
LGLTGYFSTLQGPSLTIPQATNGVLYAGHNPSNPAAPPAGFDPPVDDSVSQFTFATFAVVHKELLSPIIITGVMVKR